jgi:peptide/nickel transport system ATP-binding protein
MTAAASDAPVIEVHDLTVDVDDPGGLSPLVDQVSLTIAAGQIVGVVGESGAGKSITALAMTRMLPPGVTVTGGEIRFEGEDLGEADDRTLRQIRGGQIGMVFQDPLSALNPLMTVGSQITEALRLHGAGRREARARARDLLGLVGIRDPQAAVDDYPHAFSGGMRQRVMIAIAVANNPKLLIADEPTTGLDVTIQAEVLALIGRLRDELGTAVMLVTHDIEVVEEMCDRITVMYGGRVAESGPLRSVLSGLRHPYTWQLIRSVPRLDGPLTRRLPTIPGAPPDVAQETIGCRFAPRCAFAQQQCREQQPPLRPGPNGPPDHLGACFVINDAGRTLEIGVIPPDADVSEAVAEESRPAVSPASGTPVVELEDLVVDYRAFRRGRRDRDRAPDEAPAVNRVSLTVLPGRVLGIVGESGSGKTTLARAMVGLLTPTAGRVAVGGQQWAGASAAQRAAMRRTVQLVFQDPLASMNPRWRVREIVGEALVLAPPDERPTAAELLKLVGLGDQLLERYPDELSGGQRQRVGIARALAVRPQVIVADEPVSALDVSVQAQVLNVLCDLRDELSVGLVFVAHDLAVARHVCDEIAVMYRGQIVERGQAEEVLRHPRHEYTRRLVASVPGAAAGSTPPTSDERSTARAVGAGT